MAPRSRPLAACAGALVLAAVSCHPMRPGPAVATPPQDLFWSRIESLCGRAFAGRLSEGSQTDSVFRRAALIMHVRSCTPTEIRIPFHADADRSRTWVLTRTTQGLRLKHDHRHADGTEDRITQYGGDTQGSGSSGQQEFFADAHTASLIPAARTNVWTVEIVPGERFVYALRRVGTDRRFRVEFDMGKPVAQPPAPWGATPIPFHQQPRPTLYFALESLSSTPRDRRFSTACRMVSGRSIRVIYID